jgi:hypothetical protein
MNEFQKPKEYVFLDGEPLIGTSHKTGVAVDYEMYKITFADPDTFENHKLDYKKTMDLSVIKKGTRVYIDTEFVAGWGKNDSRSLVVNVIPVSVKQ